MLSAVATDLKDFTLSSDGKEAKFVLVTKYAGDIEVTVPAECLTALQTHSPTPPEPIVLQRSPAERANRPSAAPGTMASVPAAQHSNFATDGGALSGSAAAANPKGNVVVSIPKTWIVGADAKRGVVVVVLNHQQMDGRVGFALDPKAALELAAALTKQTDRLPAPKV